MAARIIDGKQVAAAIRAECKARVDTLRQTAGMTPGLAAVLVGQNPASLIYLRNKARACEEAGIRFSRHDFPETADPQQVIDTIEALNANPEVNGILVQLPMPKHFPLQSVLRTISADKDVDGFHLYNVGGLVLGNTVFPPCTPYGVVKLLEHEQVPLEGQNVVVVGASNIVGKPMALMLMQRDATVCICHAKTRDLAQFTVLADILVVAAGHPDLITGPMVKPGAVVIDVGINRLPDGRLVGDVQFDTVKEKAALITPVPGGVGPMTVTMLLVNTIASAEREVRGLTLAKQMAARAGSSVPGALRGPPA